MREYETLFVQHPEVTEARCQEVNTRVRNIIEEQGGRVLSFEPWGIREIAYPIQKQKKGYYVLVRYQATPAAVNELERNLKLLEEVIRFLTVRAPGHLRKRGAKSASLTAMESGEEGHSHEEARQ